jgi:hypothetical protein
MIQVTDKLAQSFAAAPYYPAVEFSFLLNFPIFFRCSRYSNSIMNCLVVQENRADFPQTVTNVQEVFTLSFFALQK